MGPRGKCDTSFIFRAGSKSITRISERVESVPSKCSGCQTVQTLSGAPLTVTPTQLSSAELS